MNFLRQSFQTNTYRHTDRRDRTHYHAAFADGKAYNQRT